MQQKNYPQMPSIKVAFLGLGVIGLLQLPEKRRVEPNLYLPVSAMTMI